MKNAAGHLVAVVFAFALCGCQPAHYLEQQKEKSNSESSRLQSETPYAVGSITTFINDFTRGYDSVAGIDDGFRVLITEIWYPIEHDIVNSNDHSLRRATYGDYVFGDRDVHRLMMTGTTFFHLTPETVKEGVTQTQIDMAIEELFTRPRNSFVDAPIADGTTPWPIIVMTHGDAGSRYNMESVCEFLAAHGYVVMAPEHTGNSPYSQTSKNPILSLHGGDPDSQSKMQPVTQLLNPDGTYGPVDNFGQSYTPLSSGASDPSAMVKLDKSLLQRVNDLRATLNEVDNMNREGKFSGQLDLNKVGLMGRSYGGATTLAALALEPRFKSGMAVVPLVMPDFRANFPPQLLHGADQESVILAKQGPFGLGDIVKPTLILSGAEDGLIIGVGEAMAENMGTTPPTPESRYPVLSNAIEKTHAPVVMGVLADSNHGSFGVSGPYWWPELKPNSQKRYFDTDEEFTLIDMSTAHLIQKELALNFFDLTVRDDQSAKEKLLDNRFAGRGLVLTSRNVTGLH